MNVIHDQRAKRAGTNLTTIRADHDRPLKHPARSCGVPATRDLAHPRATPRFAPPRSGKQGATPRDLARDHSVIFRDRALRGKAPPSPEHARGSY